MTYGSLGSVWMPSKGTGNRIRQRYIQSLMDLRPVHGEFEHTVTFKGYVIYPGAEWGRQICAVSSQGIWLYNKGDGR